MPINSKILYTIYFTKYNKDIGERNKDVSWHPYCILKRNKDIFEDLYCVLLLSGEILDSLNQGLSARYVKARFAVLVFDIAGSQFALVVKNFG